MRPASEPEDLQTKEIIKKALEIHRVLGPGLLESVYEYFLAQELTKAGMLVERQKGIPVEYDGVRVDLGFRTDLVVDQTIIVEVKAIQRLEHVHEAQLLSYLRLSGIERGLLINFHADPLRNGIRRFVLSKKYV